MKKRSMDTDLFFFIFIIFFPFSCCNGATYSITPTQPIEDGQTLLSSSEEFALGFFSPDNSKNLYVGIWYNKIPKRTYVWVANREKPVTDSAGKFAIRDDGNLAILDGRQSTTWATKINSTAASKALHAVLKDSGNLILKEGNLSHPGRTLWESFDEPTDTFLPGMNMGITPKTGTNKILSSWRSPNDPASGIYTFGVNPQQPNQFFVWRGSVLYWRSGIWNGRTFEELLELSMNPNFNFSVSYHQQDVYFTYSSLLNNYARIVIEHSGHATSYVWNNKTETWDLVSSQPKDRCSIYAACGAYGICNNINDKLPCTCPRGFEPMSTEEWSSGYWSSGCKRQRELECNREDEFLHLERMKDSNQESSWVDLSEEGCRADCLNNCRCNAYAYVNGTSTASKCMILSGDLKDLKEDTNGRQDLYVRVAAAKLYGNRQVTRSSRNKKLVVLIVTTLTIGVLLLCTSCCLWKRFSKKNGTRERLQLTPDQCSSASASRERNIQNRCGFSKNKKEDLDVPFFDLKSIVMATENFSYSNKLGEGGFGPVYKGSFPDGQQIAVKRLSANSGQGLEEFRNEVILIAKLQHRNLVRLLGYCFEGDEKMLLYEYMPNKSLDSFLFDQTRCKLLNWEKRYSIILGIVRGLLYLHHDSRLRVIHRDLKASNILLDEEMNPKISDFGLARIFGGNQTEANTKRVVGTYGYMSPEYALDGLFSIKSDVYSFGVLVLEIITGRKSTRIINDDGSQGLLGHVWRLWKEGNGLDLIDPSLVRADETSEVLKCIHVGLLCVQQEAVDRPTMASVLAMLITEAATLPTPQQPAFCTRRNTTEAAPSSAEQRSISKNAITNTLLEGR